ncbi:MAG: hypothetical protein IJQ37_04375 [Clostridia bacterium]|nr:hypothetical protein [Clostridia bacterium]
MRIIFVFIGCFFLIDPTVELIDILPDAIGVGLILFGMSKLSDLYPKIAEAKRRATVALYVALAKALCLVGTLTRFFDGTMSLTLSLVFGVLECIFLMPALSSFFDALGDISPHKKERANIKTLTTVFFVLRAVGACAPGIAGMIGETSGGGVSAVVISGDRLRVALYVIFGMATLAFGIVWLAFSSKAISFVRQDKELISSLEKRYELDVLQNPDFMLSRRVGRFAGISIAAMIMLLTIRIEGNFIVPEFLFGIIMLIALAFSGEYGKGRGIRVLLVAFSVSGAAQYVFTFIYTSEFSDVFAPYESSGFMHLYLPMAVCAVISYVLLAGSFIASGRVIDKMIDASVGLRGVYNDGRRSDIDSDRRRTLKGRVRAFVICACVYSAFAAGGVCAMPYLEWAWIIKLLLCALLVSFYVYISRTVSTEAQNAI